MDTVGQRAQNRGKGASMDTGRWPNDAFVDARRIEKPGRKDTTTPDRPMPKEASAKMSSAMQKQEHQQTCTIADTSWAR